MGRMSVEAVLTFALLCLVAAVSVWVSSETFVELPGAFDAHLPHVMPVGVATGDGKLMASLKSLGDRPMEDDFPAFGGGSIYGMPASAA
jgi:hypothetical protein